VSTEGKLNTAGFIGYKHDSTALKQEDGINNVAKQQNEACLPLMGKDLKGDIL